MSVAETKNRNCPNICQRGLDGAVFTVEKTEPFGRISKLTVKVIEFVRLSGGHISLGFVNLSSALKSTSSLFDACGLVGRIQELACPNKDGDYFFKTASWRKQADRICLTAASVFKTVAYGAKMGFIALGKLTTFAVGKLPVFGLVGDTFVVLSSFFGTWESAQKMPKVSKGLSEANEKVEKWARRSLFIETVRGKDQTALDQLKQKYEQKIALLQEVLKKEETTKAKASLAKYEHRLELINTKKHVELADELLLCSEFKKKKWSVVQSNRKIERNKTWLGISSGVSKIAIITIATTAVALSLTTLPYLLGLTGFGIAVDSIGVTKTYYDFYAPMQSLPTWENFTAA